MGQRIGPIQFDTGPYMAAADKVVDAGAAKARGIRALSGGIGDAINGAFALREQRRQEGREDAQREEAYARQDANWQRDLKVRYLTRELDNTVQQREALAQKETAVKQQMAALAGADPKDPAIAARAGELADAFEAIQRDRATVESSYGKFMGQMEAIVGAPSGGQRVGQSAREVVKTESG
jgi:hypothetical protein